MINNFEAHTFHVPVMGIGFTIDTPIKVAHLGISSVISLVDDILIEKMREFYSKKFNLPFLAISDNKKDYRAERITAYLNLVHKIVKENFNKLKSSIYEKGSEIEKYFNLLPDYSELKKKFIRLLHSTTNTLDIQNWLHNNLVMGAVDVNIMTKVDKENTFENEKLPSEYNDAHAALRGFAKSDLESSIVLSAGMNPKLYSYFEKHQDFYPDVNGKLKKKIILKISDYRSALIQGKYLAKKGLWVSEYRVESGLNCGGHAFASHGYLLGPILEELKFNKVEFIKTLHELYTKALKDKKRCYPEFPISIKFSAQGGVGTAKEHEFLLEHYKLDSIGWGTPFLLVPDVTNVDVHTRRLLSEATEKDLYLSNISPLGIPFNSLKTNTKDIEKNNFIDKGRPGSPCPEKYCSLNNEFNEEPICTASREYQNLKIIELYNLNLFVDEHKIKYDKIVEKACLCVGLSTSALLVNDLSTKTGGPGVSVCPGPNMAYFSEITSLQKMVDHIYGRQNLIKRKDRPNLFIKELELNVDFFQTMVDEFPNDATDIQKKHLLNFRKNINEGINYYKDFFLNNSINTKEKFEDILESLEMYQNKLNCINIEVFV